jgi:hypothetical protein
VTRGEEKEEKGSRDRGHGVGHAVRTQHSLHRHTDTQRHRHVYKNGLNLFTPDKLTLEREKYLNPNKMCFLTSEALGHCVVELA